MEETIDFFKYKSLLAKLESIKGTKKPIHDFIKEIYKLSNELKCFNSDYKEQPQTARYSYMLVSRALTYDGSAKPVKAIIIAALDNLRDNLLNKFMVTSENIIETYEFCNYTITISPKSIKDLHKLVYTVQPCIDKKFYISHYSINEIALFTYNRAATRLFIEKYNPDSILLKELSFDQKQHDKTLQEIQELVNNFTSILMEQNDKDIQ